MSNGTGSKSLLKNFIRNITPVKEVKGTKTRSHNRRSKNT